jgi:adenosylmethionine-8-amino-7-oxononanoate aminotransferase
VALASLDVFEAEQVLARVQERSRQLSERLVEFASLPHVGDVRQWGLMAGIELVADRGRRPYQPAERIGMRVTAEARNHGVVLRPLGNVVVLMPPLSITGQELDLLCTVTREAVLRVTGTA